MEKFSHRLHLSSPQERSKLQQRKSPERIQHDTRGRIRTSLSHKLRQPTEVGNTCSEFDAPEIWHEPRVSPSDKFYVLEYPAGKEYMHPATGEEVRDFIQDLPARIFPDSLEIVQLSTQTRKRLIKPLYGMQWGTAVYLYPIESDLRATFTQAPTPVQKQSTEKYGGRWINNQNGEWHLVWETQEAVRDYYLHNVLMHEIGHMHDKRNTNFEKREQFADAFAIEYGDNLYREKQPPRAVKKRHHVK